ncbi:DUF7133 domain-containing protein [Pelagicoccus mobilis]|uniref:DUF7133 domain-containing protein n=1 Tax=Pelagicoccus mobilis TaxID=415221 RepID=A0A934RWY1_9BACT|nr:hypothetical protein [Pelagicoccus mobilis]MBK1875907.1 hypothetical protein [Pelagicoccus mobilis]
MIRSCLALISLSDTSLLAQSWQDHYVIENVPLPVEIDKQIGGMLTLRDGRIAASFYSGEILIFDQTKNEWSLFAQGLQCPLGMVEDPDGAIVTSQWSELTRLRDTDGDGEADVYETVWDDFGISGNYHEFNFGPAVDHEGNYYVALNVASNFAGTFEKVRGPIIPIGLEESVLKGWKDNPDWPTIKKKAGRMYSRVPYRGCVMKISPDGKGTPFAYGFRSPDGIGFDDKGRLWVTDNQGDWRGTSPLYHVTEGNFYGHPASLVWKEGWTQDPLEVPVEQLQSMRTPAAALFPHGELANSPTQPIPTIAPEKFGLPEGEVLIGDMNQPILSRFLADKVGETVQGAFIPFLPFSGLGMGNHRFCFDQSGALWVGKTHLKWAGDEGIRKITWTGKPLFFVEEAELKQSGFKLRLNASLSEALPKITVVKHTYHYHAAYGSPKVNEQEVEVSEVNRSSNGKTLKFKLPEITPGYLYTIKLEGAKATDGSPLMGDTIYYNVVETK